MLSLSMVVRDEALRLERCLASVAGFVDEMVVVDTGSQDDSAAIAERLGARVQHLPWPGDFAPARNQALRAARGEWVLVLDGDELLLPEAIPPLRRLMAEPDALLINLLRREEGARQAPYSSVSRLFRRHPAIHWSGAYHAQVDDSITTLLQREPHWRLLDCPVPALLHEGYRPELLEGSGKAGRLRAAMEAELSRQPGDPYACAKLGGLEWSEGHGQRAVALLEQGLAHCRADQTAERFELLLHLALARSASAPALAADLYRQAIGLPLNPRVVLAAQLNLSVLLLEQGQLAEAAERAEAACAAAPELATAWLQRGRVARQQGNLANALAAYREAIARDPQLAEAHQNLAVACLLAGDIPGARRGFSTALRCLRQQGRKLEADALAVQAGALVKLEP
ncbi:MAG: glycosyltransferase [Cyanobacteriota bacterium]|nr:glycosyltransferase [Cyanobacteriota bacterium]